MTDKWGRKLGLAALGVLALGLWPGLMKAEETHHVTPKPDTVQKDDKIDPNKGEPEAVLPESLTDGTMVTKTFLPPAGTGMTFTKFPKSDTHVDVEVDPGTINPTRGPDTEAQIKVTAAGVPANAAMFPLKCEGNLSGTGTGGKPPHWSAKITSGEVVFNPEPVKTGFALKDDGTLDPKKIKETVTATFKEKALAANAKIVVDDPNGRIEPIAEGDLTRNAGAGTITFDVYGKTATPVGQPNGDATIKATKADDTPLKGEAQVIVQVPDKIGKPHPQPSGAVPATNIGLNEKTSPGIYQVPENQVALTTVYLHKLTVQVVDQFGKNLGAAYEGQSIFEHFEGEWRNTNRRLAKAGSYEDPCGAVVPLVVNGEVFLVAKNGTEHTAWEQGNQFVIGGATVAKGFQCQLGPGDYPAMTFDLKIAGHKLSQGVVNRAFKATAPNIIKVVWPD